MLVSSVVPRTRITLRVFVRHRGPKSVKDSSRSDILRGNENDGFTLALDLKSLLPSRTISFLIRKRQSSLELTMISETSGSLSLSVF